jgi:ubiquinone/menaquinone biosynthesis C-methylase UbiE
MSIYENHILPRLIDWGCNQDAIRQRRAGVVPQARGRVLEIGVGSGHNLPFYAHAHVEQLVGIDPGEPMLKLARQRLGSLPFAVELINAGAEDIPLPDASVDTVVMTFTLCTIPNVEAALAQMRRVLKPDGRLLFAEHGRAPDIAVQRWQDRVNPVWRKLFGGCNVNRDISLLLQESGFRISESHAGYAERTPRIAGYMSSGIAFPV